MKPIKSWTIEKSERGQRMCDAKEARGELCDCNYCYAKRMIDNEGIREVFGDC